MFCRLPIGPPRHGRLAWETGSVRRIRPTVRKKQQRNEHPRKRTRQTRSTAKKVEASHDSSTRARCLQVKGDMLRNPALTFTQAARNRNVDPRSVLKHFRSGFYKDSSGRIKARPSDRSRQTLYTPSTKPGVSIPVPTRGRPQRLLVGRWMAAINAARSGDFSELKKFTRGQFVGGVRLPTGTHEVQLILNARAEEEAPYEGLYRSIARPS